MLLRLSPMLPSPKAETEEKPPVHSLMTWILHVLYILYWLEVGGFLLLMPWMPLWENNYLLYLYPQLRPIVANSFLKGGVLGLGIVNLLIGIQEIVHFKRNYLSR